MSYGTRGTWPGGWLNGDASTWMHRETCPFHHKKERRKESRSRKVYCQRQQVNTVFSVVSITRTYIYIYITKLILHRGFWIAALEKQETSVLRVEVSGSGESVIFSPFSLLQPLQFLPRWTRNSFYAIRWYVTRKFCVWRRSSVVSAVVEHWRPSSPSFHPLRPILS